MKVFELKKKKSLSHAIHAIALVEKPAIETDFIYLSIDGKKAESNIYLSEEKGIIYSPVLIPNQRIKRLNENTGEVYEIFFSKETIEEAAYDMMTAKTPLDQFNEEHTDKKINGTNVVELWLVDDPAMDKATKLGFNVVAGTLMAGIKVTDEEAKEKIRLGKIKGISIEALFNEFELTEENGQKVELNTNTIMNKLEQKIDSLMTKLSEIVGAEKAPETKLASEKSDKGMLYTADAFQEGEMVYTDEAMTMNADGEYMVGNQKYVIDAGVLVAREMVEQVEEQMPSQPTRMAEENAKATIALNEKVISLERENETLKTELTAIKESVEKHSVLLKAVEESKPESLTKLSAEPESSVVTYLNNRKKY